MTEPIELPPPWPTRPWIYANVIASRNGIVAWIRTDAGDDPVRAVAGGDFDRPGRRADLRLMRRLRAEADAVAFGAQTLRDQPDLIGGVDDVGAELGEALHRIRAERGRRRVPLQVIYSESGRLDLRVPMFNTPDVAVVVVTTGAGARLLRANGSVDRGVSILATGEVEVEPAGLVLAHERLFQEFGVQHLVCEGGAVILDALHDAGILDEIFVTVSDVHVDPAAHVGIKRIALPDTGAGRLVSEQRPAADPGYRFQRWRFNEP